MSSLSFLATGFQAAGALFGTVGAYNSSKATKVAYEYQAAVERNNAVLARQQATDAIRRGQSAEGAVRLRAGQTAGAQRARMAANGVALDEGSPLNILQDTEYLSTVDALTARDNAAREAWGFQVQGQNASNNAQLLQNRAANENPLFAAGAALLTGAGSVAEGWYRRRSLTEGRLAAADWGYRSSNPFGITNSRVGSYDGW